MPTLNINVRQTSKLAQKLTINLPFGFIIHFTSYFLFSLSGIATLTIGGYGKVIQTGSLELLRSSDEVIPSLKAHSLTALLLMALFVLHVIGVIKHYLFTKENTLKRIS